MNMQPRDFTASSPAEPWVGWPVYWSAVWVGALVALAVALVIGLTGIALGAHLIGPGHEIVSWRKFGIGALIFSVVGAFFAFVAGGWVAGKIAGIRRSEPAMLHGGIVWLLSVPAFLIAASVGAGSFFGSWQGGLTGSPSWATAAPRVFPPPAEDAPQKDKDEYNSDSTPDKAHYQVYMAAKVARNNALGAVTALLLGLVGAVLGGWLASGEPMHPFYYRTRVGRQTATTYPVTSEMSHSV